MYCKLQAPGGCIKKQPGTSKVICCHECEVEFCDDRCENTPQKCRMTVMKNNRGYYVYCKPEERSEE